MRKAWSWRRYLSRRQSFASSTTERSMLPRYSSSFASKREKRANASAALPAKPARILSWYSRRTFAAPCFITVVPTVTCPSPPTATLPSRRTQTTVVAWISSIRRRSLSREPCRDWGLQRADARVLEFPSVEHQTRRGRGAVALVTRDRVSDGGEVDPDLVGTA